MKIKIIILLLLCFTTALNAQEEDEVAEVSQEACQCLNDISIMLPQDEKYSEISDCISSSILGHQMNKTLMDLTNKVLDTINSNTGISTVDSLNIESNDIIIVADKNYKEIENYLLDNCDYMNSLMSNNDEKSENSVSDKEEALEHYYKGQEYFSQEKYNQAIQEYKKAIKKDRKFPFALDMLGYSYRRIGKYKEAIKYYNKSIKIDPNGRVPLMNKPIAYELLNDIDNAILGYLDFITVFPDDPEGYYGIGRMYHNKGDYEKALENTMRSYILYNKIKSPYARDAERNLGIFYRELKEKGQLELFKRIAKKYKINIEQ